MSGFWLTPAAPGTVAPVHLDKVRELHGTVRDWIERSATAQRNEHLQANLPYVDLMFAFGFATLGDHPTANKLVVDARKVMEGPIPAVLNSQDQENARTAIVSGFISTAFQYRTRQALKGERLAGPLGAEVRVALGKIRTIASTGWGNLEYKLALYDIDRFRVISSIVEPDERIDPYQGWTQQADELKRELGAVHDIHDPVRLAARLRNYFHEKSSETGSTESQFYSFVEALSLAARTGEEFAIEMVQAVPRWLSADIDGAKASPILPTKQGQLLATALSLAALRASGNRDDAGERVRRARPSLTRSSETNSDRCGQSILSAMPSEVWSPRRPLSTFGYVARRGVPRCVSFGIEDTTHCKARDLGRCTPRPTQLGRWVALARRPASCRPDSGRNGAGTSYH